MTFHDSVPGVLLGTLHTCVSFHVATTLGYGYYNIPIIKWKRPCCCGNPFDVHVAIRRSFEWFDNVICWTTRSAKTLFSGDDIIIRECPWLRVLAIRCKTLLSPLLEVPAVCMMRGYWETSFSDLRLNTRNFLTCLNDNTWNDLFLRCIVMYWCCSVSFALLHSRRNPRLKLFVNMQPHHQQSYCLIAMLHSTYSTYTVSLPYSLRRDSKSIKLM